MLEDLEMFKRTTEQKQLVGEMLMLEDVLKDTFWGGVWQRVELIMTKFITYNGTYTGGDMRNYSRYCLGELIRKRGYFRVNDLVEEKIVFYSETNIKHYGGGS